MTVLAYLVGIACFALMVLATLGTERLTPTRSPDEPGRSS